MTIPVLALPNVHDLFLLETDASDHVIGAELCQVQEGKERIIVYESYTLTPQQKILYDEGGIAGGNSIYPSDQTLFVRQKIHSSLTWLLNFKEPQSQLERWLEE